MIRREGRLGEELRNRIAGKKVLLLGYGREGRSTWNYLKRVGGYESVVIADENMVSEADIPVISGEGYQDCINDFDVVFKSPGVVLKRDSSELSCEILSQTEVFFRCYRDQIIGITGTKGKSTTTTLFYHILKKAGYPVLLAGNIGIPVFDIEEEIAEGTILVVELSAHQLEYMTVSPRIAVLLNIYEEHLDHYGTMEKYVAAKKKIYRNQKEGDLFLCNLHDLPEQGTCSAKILSIANVPERADIQIADQTIQFGKEEFVIPQEEMKLIGHHNYFDIGVSYVLAKEIGISDEVFRRGLISYEPLPHRLQFIASVNGVNYYDDSISTICETTIQALESLQNVDSVLIGGMDRGIDYGALIRYLDHCQVSHIILMENTGERIYEEIQKYYPEFTKKERLHLVKHLKEAVESAKKFTPSGKSCVLSPAAASYGIFRNFEERGEVFKQYVLS